MDDDAKASRPPARERNPEKTTRDILAAARDEFVEHGLNGARMDRIAQRAKANKRLIYHYVGDKEALYERVLLEAYRYIREGEHGLHLPDSPPQEAMERLVGFTFDHFAANPWFIRLLQIENIHHGAHLRALTEARNLTSPIIRQIEGALRAGEAAGVFRARVDPVQFYITIISLSYFYFSNIHTLSVIFANPLDMPESRAARRAHVISVAQAYLKADQEA